MKKGSATGSKFLIAAIAALALTTGSTFAGAVIGLGSDRSDSNQPVNNQLVPISSAGYNILPVPPLAAPGGGIQPLSAAADLFWRTDGTGGGTWSTSTFWSNPATATGGTAWTSGDDAFFTATSTLTFGTTAVSDVTVSNSSTVTVTAALTLTLAGVRTYDIGAGSTLNWASQTWSAAAANEGSGIIKNGGGILNLGAIPVNVRYDGGFTLNAGTVIVSGDNSFGSAGGTIAPVLNINGGTIQSSGTRSFAPTTINIGGNFTMTGTGNATFGGAVSLGAASRTITNSQTTGSLIFSGVISGNAGVGVTFAGTGVTTLSGASPNTYSGGTTITGGTLMVTKTGGLGTGNVSLTAGAVTLTLQGASNDYINDAATLSYVNTDIINLNYTGTDTIAGLTVDGVAQGTGVYGVGFINPDGAFAGTGTITVVPEPTTVAMMVLGGSLLVGMQRFRRKLR